MIEECKKGDKEALNLFYLRFAPRMLSVIHRYIPDEKDAEDVLHDGFIVALTRLDSLRDAGKTEIWLATIMKNLSLRFLQAQDMATILHDIPEVEDTPDIDTFIDLDTLESLIEKLPSGYQKVFRLAFLENKSHKEIGNLLGIAPKSSASQLHHAKLMMRELITEYKLQIGLGCLLAIAILTGIVLHNHQSQVPDVDDVLISEADDSSIEPVTETPLISPDNKVKNPAARTATKPNTRRNAVSDPYAGVYTEGEDIKGADEEPGDVSVARQPDIQTLAQGAPTTDSIRHGDIPSIMNEHGRYTYIEENDYTHDPVYVRKSEKGWSVKIGADPALLSFNDFGLNDDLADFNQYPDDGYPLGPDEPDDEDGTRKMHKNAKTNTFKDYKYVSQTHYLPITVALTASRNLSHTFSVESGVRYTYLHSSFETTTSKAHCHWHYAGIPVKLNIKICSGQRFNFYAGFGGMVDIPLYSNATVTTTSSHPDLRPGSFKSPVVWSLSGNLGISVKLSKKIDIFLEPTLQYHFEQKYTVPNIWTEDKWGVSLPLGFRFNM